MRFRNDSNVDQVGWNNSRDRVRVTVRPGEIIESNELSWARGHGGALTLISDETDRQTRPTRWVSQKISIEEVCEDIRPHYEAAFDAYFRGQNASTMPTALKELFRWGKPRHTFVNAMALAAIWNETSLDDRVEEIIERVIEFRVLRMPERRVEGPSRTALTLNRSIFAESWRRAIIADGIAPDGRPHTREGYIFDPPIQGRPAPPAQQREPDMEAWQHLIEFHRATIQDCIASAILKSVQEQGGSDEQQASTFD